MYSLLKSIRTQHLIRKCTPVVNLLSSLPDTVTKQIESKAKEQITDQYADTLSGKAPSVLDACKEEDVAHIAPYLKPTFNFAAYVNQSETLQELLKLGVDLHKLEKSAKVPEFLLALKFETDIKSHVIFLHDIGLSVEDIGKLITKNPFIFRESLENIEVRINYLQSKLFTNDMILRIVSANPNWLSTSTRKIDERLGYFQKMFALTGDEVRYLATKQPQLITYNPAHVQKSLFALKEEMGFTDQECKLILLQKPRLLMNDPAKTLQTFEYLHQIMQIPLEMIVKMPEVLSCRVFRLQQRFQYLKLLGKVQFNPKEPGYISPVLIVAGTDTEFCSNVAKTTIDSFNTFLKTV